MQNSSLPCRLKNSRGSTLTFPSAPDTATATPGKVCFRHASNTPQPSLFCWLHNHGTGRSPGRPQTASSTLLSRRPSRPLSPRFSLLVTHLHLALARLSRSRLYFGSSVIMPIFLGAPFVSFTIFPFRLQALAAVITASDVAAPSTSRNSEPFAVLQFRNAFATINSNPQAVLSVPHTLPTPGLLPFCVIAKAPSLLD